ncbi:hypothetical protein NFI96_032985 [Prochilodus magdalenae]|nr:hypothetical protein NFI96_032985 [Prochilodus magdalenae]
MHNCGLLEVILQASGSAPPVLPCTNAEVIFKSERLQIFLPLLPGSYTSNNWHSGKKAHSSREPKGFIYGIAQGTLGGTSSLTRIWFITVGLVFCSGTATGSEEDIHQLDQRSAFQVLCFVICAFQRCSPSLVQDLFVDLRDGTRLLDLLEAMSGQRMKREKGHGLFQQRGNVETALNFLKNKSIKLVNINIPDIIEGKPSIILGLIWTIILHCHIEELASTLSFGSRSSSLESLSSQDSAPGTPVRGSPVPRRTSPLHARFRLSAKKALLLWVRDQCRKVGCSVSVKDFKSSWRSGVAFLAILCSLRPDLVDLSLTETRSNLQNLEEAFCIAQQELGIPRLLEPEDVDISNPDEKSIMTYVAQFLQYTNDLPSTEDDLEVRSPGFLDTGLTRRRLHFLFFFKSWFLILQTLLSPKCLSPINLLTHFTPAVLASPLYEASPSQKVREMTCWLQRAYEDLLDVWSSTEGEGYAGRYQAFQSFVGSFHEQRWPVIPMLSAMKRSAKLSEEQLALRKAWDLIEERLQQYKAELDAALPAPLHTLSKWLQNMEAVLSEEPGDSKDHAGAARDARERQEKLKVLLSDMSGHLDTLHQFCNPEDDVSSRVPAEKLDEMKRRFTNARVTAKYHGIKLEYQEQWHHVQELLGHLKNKLKSWRGPYGSQEAVVSLMQDWHDSINTQGLVSMLKAALQNLKQTASTYKSKAALAGDSGAVSRQVKEAERETEASAEAAVAARDTMDRVRAEWEFYKECSYSLHVFLEGQTQATGKEQTSCSPSEWCSCQAKLNEAGNYLIEVTENSTSSSLAEELSRLNIKWADFIKRTKFAVAPQQLSNIAPCAQATQMLMQEAGWILREAVQVSSGALRRYRKKLRVMVKKISELDLDSLSPSPEFSEEALKKLRNTFPQMREDLSRVEQACEGLQKGASLLEGRLAELGHWSTEALEVCHQLKDWQHRHQGPHPRAKKLISRGLQLESQVGTEAQGLQSLLENVQRSSSLPYLSISALQDRVKCTVRHCQEIIDTLSCMGVKHEGHTEGGHPPPKVVVRAYSTPELQAGTLQKHEALVSEVPQESRKSYGCSQTQKYQDIQPSIQPQELSLGDPQDKPSVPLKDVQLKQAQNVLPSHIKKKGKMEAETEVQILTTGQSQSRMSLKTPEQCPGSPISNTSTQNMCSIQPVTSQQQRTDAQSKSKPQTTTTTLDQHYQLFPPSREISYPHVKTPPQAQTKLHMQGDTPTHTHLGISPHTSKQAQAQPKSQSPRASQRLRGQGKAAGAAHVPGQTEVYLRAQAMARSRMEKAKQRLHEHIEEVITIFSNRILSEEQARRKQGALRHLKPEVLEEFLEAVDGVGAFCSEAQLRDMEDLSLSVRVQWEAVRSAIESFLPDLWQEVQRRESINMAALKCEIDTNTACVPDQVCSEQACFSDVEPKGRLEALQGLSETLRLPTSSCLATSHLRESGCRLETVHYQDSRGEQAKDNTLLRETGLPSEQLLSQIHSQTLKQQTEDLWLKLELQSSSHMEDGCSVKSERDQLIHQWRGQQICFEARMRSLERALQLLEPADVHIKLISDQLNQLVRKPVDIDGFALTDARAVHADIKLLGENIQKELKLLAEFESNSAGLSEAELQAHLPLQQTIHNCTHRLQYLNHQLVRTRSALKMLEHLLPSLQQLDVELAATLGLPASSAASVKQRLQQVRVEAVELDRMLQDAGMSLKLGTKTGSCQDLVSALFSCAKEKETNGAERIRGAQGKEEEEQRVRALKKRKKALLLTLREVQGMLERQSLKEPTLPALQHRLRCLTDMESKLDTLLADIQNLQVSSAHTLGLTELEAQWKETHRTVTESREECLSLIELLKKFQSCRSHLGGTLQRAEQTITEQASYMGKDNLQRLFSRVSSVKSDLSALGDGVEEFRSVCRQLQSQMKKIPDCPDTPFESEADALMDRWLDVTERTDCCLDNLQIGLSLWEKLLVLAGEVDGWTTRKLMVLAQSQPFQTEEEVTAVQDELRIQEENIEHFHQRSAEIQELLQTTEHPLELQVIESQLRKRMGEVKELFSETGDVFKELVAAKTQVAARMAECMSAILAIRDALNTLGAAGNPQFSQDIQVLSEQLQAEAEQAGSVLQQVTLLANVASPESLTTLVEEGVRLQESIYAVKEMIMLKKEQTACFNNAKETLNKDVDSHGLPVQGSQNLVPMQPNLTDTQHPQSFSTSHKTKRSAQGSKENPSPQEMQDTTHLEESTGSLASRLQVGIRDTDTQKTQEDIKENLKGLQVGVGLKAEDNSDENEMVKVQTPFHKREIQDDLHALSDQDKQSRLPQGEVACSPSFQNQLQQVENRLQQLQEQKAELPVLFPWSGLVERRAALQHAHGLLERARVLGSEITTLRDQMKKQTFEGLTELSFSSLEKSVFRLIQHLSDTCAALDEGIQKEQHCSLMVQQCSEILDCLERRMQEKVTMSPGKQDQKSELKALKDLLQDVTHEDRRLQEIESLTAALLRSCTTEGQMALSHDVQSLLKKKTMLQTSIHKQLGREGYQTAEQGCFENGTLLVAADIKKEDMDTGDTQINMEPPSPNQTQQSTSVMKHMADSAASCPPHQHPNALDYDATMDPEISISNQERQMLDSVAVRSHQWVETSGSPDVPSKQLDEVTETDDTTQSANITSQQWTKSSPDEPAPKKNLVQVAAGNTEEDMDTGDAQIRMDLHSSIQTQQPVMKDMVDSAPSCPPQQHCDAPGADTIIVLDPELSTSTQEKLILDSVAVTSQQRTKSSPDDSAAPKKVAADYTKKEIDTGDAQIGMDPHTPIQTEQPTSVLKDRAGSAAASPPQQHCNAPKPDATVDLDPELSTSNQEIQILNSVDLASQQLNKSCPDEPASKKVAADYTEKDKDTGDAQIRMDPHTPIQTEQPTSLMKDMAESAPSCPPTSVLDPELFTPNRERLILDSVAVTGQQWTKRCPESATPKKVAADSTEENMDTQDGQVRMEPHSSNPIQQPTSALKYMADSAASCPPQQACDSPKPGMIIILDTELFTSSQDRLVLGSIDSPSQQEVSQRTSSLMLQHDEVTETERKDTHSADITSQQWAKSSPDEPATQKVAADSTEKDMDTGDAQNRMDPHSSILTQQPTSVMKDMAESAPSCLPQQHYDAPVLNTISLLDTDLSMSSQERSILDSTDSDTIIVLDTALSTSSQDRLVLGSIDSLSQQEVSQRTSFLTLQHDEVTEHKDTTRSAAVRCQQLAKSCLDEPAPKKVADDSTEKEIDAGDPQIKMDPQPTSVVKDMAESAPSCPPQQHCDAPVLNTTSLLDTDLSMSCQERPMQDVLEHTSSMMLQHDEVTVTEHKDTTHSPDGRSQQWANSSSDEPAPKKIATIVLDAVSNPLTLKSGKQVKSSKDVDTITGTCSFHPDSAKSLDSKAGTTEPEDSGKSTDSLKEMQSCVFAEPDQVEPVEPDQAENAHTEELQTCVGKKSSSGKADGLESIQQATDSDQGARVSARYISGADVLHDSRNDKTSEHGSRSVSYQQNSTSVLIQEMAIPNDLQRKTDKLDTDQAKALTSACSEKMRILDSNEKYSKEDRTTETSTSKQTSAVSSPSYQMSDTKHPDTTITKLREKDTAKPKDLLIIDSGQEEAMSTTQGDPMNSLQSKNMDGQATAKSATHTDTSCTRPISNSPPDVKSVDVNYVIQKLVPDSDPDIQKSESEITATVPTQLEVHAEASSRDHSDSENHTCSQLQEVSRSSVSGGGESENRDSTDDSKERRRHIQDQPAEASGWNALLDIITNAQPLMDPSSISQQSQRRKGTWFLEPSPTDSESRLERTTLRVLRCRYQPAQLRTELMTQQLQEAEKCRQCVVEQLTALPQNAGGVFSQQSPSMEGRRSAALLDASATVQIKEAQLRQVMQYHQQIKTLRDTLQDLEAELNTLIQDASQSSVTQAEKLHEFLKSMRQKKALLEELLHTCCQVSVHLGEAEGPVVCLLQVKNLQEKWQILEDTADRTLRHTDVCASEASILLKDVQVLRGDLEASSHSSQTHAQCQSDIHRVITLTDFMEMNERYLYLLELHQGLFQYPVGEKERKDIEAAFQNVKAQLDCVQEKLGTHVTSPSDPPMTEIIEMVKDHFTWCRQTESRISRRKTLALFPEEANQQVNNMKKLQIEVASRRSKFASVVKKLREEIAGLNGGESSVVLSALETLENSYSKLAEISDCASAELNQMLHARQRLESQITENSTWLTSLLEKECSKSAAVELGTTIADLKVHHQRHKATLHDAEKRALVIQTLLDEIKDMIVGLSMAESFHLVDKLSTLRAEVNGVIRRKRASCWELEELLHAQESSADEFTAIQKSLRQITSDFERQRFPVTRESLSAFEPVRHMIMEHLSQVQEAQHCQEHRRKELLRTISTLQERARLLDQQAKEHEEYLTSKNHLDSCSEAMKTMVPLVSDASEEAGKRLRLGQALLVQLSLLKMSCQETADQLEAISADLYPSQLASERQKIRSIVKSLAAWEHIVSSEVKDLEHSLVGDLSNPMELTEHFMKAEEWLKQSSGLEPNDQSITEELRKCWTLEKTVESSLRMLETCKDRPPPEGYRKATETGRNILKECKRRMEKLLQAKEALKEYQWAVRGAVGFLQQVEFRFLIPSANFKDCMEELRHTQQTLASLSEGFQAHMTKAQSRLPRQECFSIVPTEKLHIQVISQLLVGDAVLEAQAQLKLKTLQRCLMEQSSHGKHHDEMSQFLRNFDCKLSESFSHKPACLEMCRDQLQEMKVLQEELEGINKRLEGLRENCEVRGCNVAADRTLGNLWRHWAMLHRRLDAFKSRATHSETEWKEVMLRVNKSREALNQLEASLNDFSKVKRSMGNLQVILTQTEQLQDALDQEHLNVVSLQRCGSSRQELSTLTELSQELQTLQSRCRRYLKLCFRSKHPQNYSKTVFQTYSSIFVILPVILDLTDIKLIQILREQISEVRRDVLSEIQEWGRLQEEQKAVQQSVFSLLSVLQNQSDPSHLQEMKVELGAQHARLLDIMNRVRQRSNEPPQEIQTLHDEITLCLQEVKEKVRQAKERASPLHRMSEQLREVTVGLNCVQALLQKKSSTVKEAENTLKRIWDELDQWHSRTAELEAEVQELAEEQPERAHMLMDELTKPLQFYQAVAKQAEQRTAFISKIPSCLQEYEDIRRSSTRWLADAQSWLDTPQTYTTAKCLHSHASSLQVCSLTRKKYFERFTCLLAKLLQAITYVGYVACKPALVVSERLFGVQMVLDESEGIRDALESFGPALEEISVVCDTSSQEQNLLQVHTSVIHMQQRALEPLMQLQHAAAEMDAIEAEVKDMEKNVVKIRTILSTVDTEDIPLEEHLLNRQASPVILDNLQVMKRTIAEIERCRAGLGLPAGAEHTLSAFHRAQQLQQPVDDLQKLTEEQSATLRFLLKSAPPHVQQVAIGHPVNLIYTSDQATASILTPPCAEDVMDPDEFLMDKEHDEVIAVVPESVSKESSLIEAKESMESVPMISETKPGNTVSPAQPTGSITTMDSVIIDSSSVPAITVQPNETLIPVSVEPALQLAVGFKVSEEAKEMLKHIRQAETLPEEPKGPAVKDLVQSEKMEASAVHPVVEDKSKDATNMGTRSKTQETLTDHLEGSISKPTKKGEDTCTSVRKVQQTDAPVSGLMDATVPALVLSHPDAETGPQDNTALQVQSELKEQRDLIEAIAHHGSNSDLEQEEQTQTQTHPRSNGVSLCVPGQPVERTTARESWTQLHHRLQTLLDSLNTLQDRTTAEVKGLDENKVDGDTGPSLTQEMHRYAEQLRHIRQNACSMGTTAAVTEGWEAVYPELCETLTGLGHSLSSITRTLQTPPERSRETYQLQLLNLQCISAQLVSVGSEIRSIGSEVTEALGSEASDVSSCLECLHSCLSSSQKALSSQEELLSRELGHTPQLQAEEQLLESPVFVLKAKEIQQTDPGGQIQDRPRLQSVQDSVWSSIQEPQWLAAECPALQHSCQALLHALRFLMELGSERVKSSQVIKPRSCSELQNLLREHKKYFHELKSHHMTIQHLSEKLPEEALLGQEEVGRKVSELLLQAQRQGAHMQYNLQLQEWSQYEEIRGRLCKQLEELEATMPSEGLDSESGAQLEERLQAYQRLQGILEESRPQLGLLLDLANALQTQRSYWEQTGQAGPGCELQANCQALQRRLEHEIQRTKEMRVNYDRFQSSSAELEAWMETAHAHVQKCNSTFDSDPQGLKLLLPKLMEFCRELESRSVQKAAAVRAGTQILQLSDSNTPELHKRLTQLEQDWTELSNILPSVQQTLNQLLAGLNHSEVMAELTSWLEHMESRLEEESSREHKALDFSELTMLLQRLKDCKAEVTSWQPCVDFLSQSVEAVGSVDDLGSRKERLLLAEQQGDLNLRWILLQRKIDSLIHETEHKKQDCKNREGCLQRLRSWLSALEEKMRANEKPASRTQIEQALKDNEEEEEKLKLKSTELLQLRNLYLLGHKDGQHPGDQAFTSQVESTIEQCQALGQQSCYMICFFQMCAVQATLGMLREHWTHFDTKLRDAALHTVSVRYKLESSKTPLFSLQQSKEHVEELQELQTELERSEETWTKLSSLCSDLKGRIHPDADLLLSHRLDREKTRRTAMIQDVGAEFQKAQSALRLWQDYRRLYGDCSSCLSHQWQQYEVLLSPLAQEENSTELLHRRLSAIRVLENEIEATQNRVAEVLVASKLLIAQTESQAAPLIQTETRLLSRDLVRLGQALARRREQLQEDLEDHVSFNTDMESLEQHLKGYESLIASTTTSPDCLKIHLLMLSFSKLALMEQSGLTPDLGDLNKRSLQLTLNASEAKHLRALNTQWVRVFSQATARHRGLYSEELSSQSFQEKCKAWMELLEKVESGLSDDISGSCSSIRKELSLHQKLKMEVLIGQQLLDAVVSEGVRLLQKGQIADRGGLILRLTQLKERWQGTLRRVQRRSRSLEQLTDKWRLYSTDLRTLWKLLKDLEPLLPPAGLAPCSLQQLQHSIQDYEKAEEQLSFHEELYTQTMQAGRQILVLADAETQPKLSAEMGALKEAWEQSRVLVEKRKALAKTVIQNFNNCEAGLAESALSLRKIIIRLKQPLDDSSELQEKLFKELEDSLELWAGGLRELATMKADVSQYVLPTDAALLQGQVEELHSQWEELCLKVSKRKQEIADRLNAWIIFNDKNKELCDWLGQMEKKVTHSNEHLSIEEMVEKLKKDCMEEINLFSENKSHLKQLGEQLLLASDRAKEAEIHGALRDVNDRWQHLFDHIEAR